MTTMKYYEVVVAMAVAGTAEAAGTAAQGTAAGIRAMAAAAGMAAQGTAGIRAMAAGTRRFRTTATT